MKIPWATGLVVISVLASTACGGGGRSNSSASNGTITPPTTSGGNSPTAVPAPTAVAVNAGSQVSSVDISVPSGAPALNAEALGIAPPGSSSGTASNTGDIVQRGTQARVLIFGTGLNGSLKVTILGPDDLSISSPVSIKSTSGLPGIEFDISVNGNATPGARTVVLQDASGNITTFTGGLEIQ